VPIYTSMVHVLSFLHLQRAQAVLPISLPRAPAAVSNFALQILRPCSSADSKTRLCGPIQRLQSATPPSCQRRRFHCFESYPFVFRLWLEMLSARFFVGVDSFCLLQLCKQPASGASSSSHFVNANSFPWGCQPSR
jgi:hypothetical protein